MTKIPSNLIVFVIDLSSYMLEHQSALNSLRRAFIEYLREAEKHKSDYLNGKIEFVFWHDSAYGSLYTGNFEEEFIPILMSEIDQPSQKLPNHKDLREYLFKHIIDVHSKQGKDAIKFVYVLGGSSASNPRADAE